MKAGEIFSYAILAALALVTLIFSDAQDMEAKAINTRLAALEDNMVDRTIPRITMHRGTVYAGSGEILIEKIAK